MATLSIDHQHRLSNPHSHFLIHTPVEVQDSISSGMVSDNHHGLCAICLNKIVLQETALVKGCEHAYCATCILRWATYKQNPTCPQCKHPFEFLILHRSLDGSIQDCMLEESVCLLLRATWFKPVLVTDQVDSEEEEFNYSYFEQDEEDELDEMYFNNALSLTIGNRRWGDGGYIRTGRRHAKPKPVYPPLSSKDSASSSTTADSNKKGADRDVTGRRAKRALKREAADKAAAAKHQNHLERLGRK